MAVISIEDIAHVRFSAPDLAQMRAFLEDFGLACSEHEGRLYGRGSDGRPFLHATEHGEPAFQALGLRAASIADLERLAQTEGTAVEPMTDPGGGSMVRLTDPDGYRVEVVAGQQAVEAAPSFPDTPHNSAEAQARLDEPLRLNPGPSHVLRIGHCVLGVANFRASERWYKERFGFLTSDEIEAAPEQTIGAFLRCDRGAKPSDHHTLFLAQLAPEPAFMHAAFEVAHLDDLMLGHAHLMARQRQHAWGIGRHAMGSQVFDYWKDPWGFELEHWTDGDLLSAEVPPNRNSFEALLGVQWGTPHPMTLAQAAGDKA